MRIQRNVFPESLDPRFREPGFSVAILKVFMSTFLENPDLLFSIVKIESLFPKKKSYRHILS